MRLLFGLFTISAGFILASIHLEQGAKSYWDFVAFFVVVFGTLSVMLITRPQLKFSVVLKYIKRGIFGSSTTTQKFVADCVLVATRVKDAPSDKTIECQFLRDGQELMSLGFSFEKIENILSLRYQNYAKTITNIANWLRKNSKYPPAFGLAGTVLGLIHLMRGISDGINPQETGIRMAVALVATFYGLIISNIFLNPIGELLIERLKHDEEKAEIAIHTIEMLMKKSSAIEVQEELNSYIEPENKMNILSAIPIEEMV